VARAGQNGTVLVVPVVLGQLANFRASLSRREVLLQPLRRLLAPALMEEGLRTVQDAGYRGGVRDDLSAVEGEGAVEVAQRRGGQAGCSDRAAVHRSKI
jgi:hypothetical protein